MKIIDLVVLLLEGDKLRSNYLQFAYQVKSSTTMCLWTASAVNDYFNRGRADVYTATVDLTKASDLVPWENLFDILQNRGVNGLFMRLILYIYMNQKCNVKWCGKLSNRFRVKNDARQ